MGCRDEFGLVADRFNEYFLHSLVQQKKIGSLVAKESEESPQILVLYQISGPHSFGYVFRNVSENCLETFELQKCVRKK